MYDDCVKNKESKPNVYEMPMKSYGKGIFRFIKALKSWSVVLVYGLLLIVILGTLTMIAPRTKIIKTDKSDITKIIIQSDIERYENESIQKEEN